MGGSSSRSAIRRGRAEGGDRNQPSSTFHHPTEMATTTPPPPPPPPPPPQPQPQPRMASPFLALFRSLGNSRWALTRTLRSDNPFDLNGELRGTATFTALPSTADRDWLYSEEGDIPTTVSGGAAQAGLRWTKKYIWRDDDAGRISVWFVKVAPGPEEADYLFHNFEFAEAASRREGQGEGKEEEGGGIDHSPDASDDNVRCGEHRSHRSWKPPLHQRHVPHRLRLSHSAGDRGGAELGQSACRPGSEEGPGDYQSLRPGAMNKKAGGETRCDAVGITSREPASPRAALSGSGLVLFRSYPFVCVNLLQFSLFYSYSDFNRVSAHRIPLII
ncbi:uncharacterized protein N7482_003211 [Penicillium canariense]|uniref:Uncharacterized protein n=1 Tax=Penicillium canariense TaxID=189055 RepID=A0A9W9I857_9EURO|nr:uncharacterized protein N7482_003211 [Penicillium canariense]KAJ5167617.1 hypothetical protein N7482_003211 [Penicillium canariense]